MDDPVDPHLGTRSDDRVIEDGDPGREKDASFDGAIVEAK
jgi:hypothetical protein